MEESILNIDQKDGIFAVKSKKSVIAILGYTLERGTLEDLYLISKKNSHFEDGIYTGIILEFLEDVDRSLLHKSKNIVLEKTGFDTEDKDWSYLGDMIFSEFFPEKIYCYAVDLSDKEKTFKPENNLTYEPIKINTLDDIEDSITNACVTKLILNIYKNIN